MNRKIWGLHKKKLTVLGARTSQGKSAFALQIAYDVALQGIPVLFLSLEMYEEDVIERIFCLSEKADNYDLLTGKFEKYFEHWENFKKKLDGIPLVVTDMLGKTCQDVGKFLDNLTIKPSLIIIDHIQEAKHANLNNQKEIIEEYLKSLRVMAIKHNFSLVVCSQINRASQSETIGGEPQVHHLKNSGYIEEGADVILLLHWPWHYTNSGDKNNFVINVAKNRNGRTGRIHVKYKPESYWFYEEVIPTADSELPENLKGVNWE